MAGIRIERPGIACLQYKSHKVSMTGGQQAKRVLCRRIGQGLVGCWVVQGRGHLLRQSPSRQSSLSLSRVFLPAGYPASVTADYRPSTALNFVSSVSGTMGGTLATQALLQALGLGAGTAIGLAASTNWLLKDGIGLFGGVLFAGLVGSRFDASPKVCLSTLCSMKIWRLNSLCINDSLGIIQF